MGFFAQGWGSFLSKQGSEAVSLEAALSPDLLRSSLLEPRFRLLPRILINPQAEGWEPNSEVSPLLPYAEEPVRAILEFVYRAHAERRV